MMSLRNAASTLAEVRPLCAEQEACQTAQLPIAQPPTPKLPKACNLEHFGRWELEIGRSLFSGSVYRRDGPEAGRHGRCPRGEERHEYVGSIEAALIDGAEQAGEDLLTVGATSG